MPDSREGDDPAMITVQLPKGLFERTQALDDEWKWRHAECVAHILIGLESLEYKPAPDKPPEWEGYDVVPPDKLPHRKAGMPDHVFQAIAAGR